MSNHDGILSDDYDFIPDATLAEFRRMAESYTDDGDEVKRLCSRFLSVMVEARKPNGRAGISTADVRTARGKVDVRPHEIDPIDAVIDVYRDKQDSDGAKVTVRLSGEHVDFVDRMGNAVGLSRDEVLRYIVDDFQRNSDH